MTKYALGASLIVLLFIFQFGLAAPHVQAGPMFEDPQLCVNGSLLLLVEPTTAPIEAWVELGPNMTVDYIVANCGGNPRLPVIDSSHVTMDGKPDKVAVQVQTGSKADVVVSFDGKVKVVKADNSGWAKFSFKAH